MARFAIVGVGGFGREILDWVGLDLRKHGSDFEHDRELVFADENPDLVGIDVLGVPTLALGALDRGDEFVVAIGAGSMRKKVVEKCLAMGLVEASAMASSVRIGRGVTYGPGGIFCENSMVTASARIGRQFQCNIYSYVAHDCVIGDYVTFAPKVCCNGNVHIGDLAYIGTGAILRQGTPDRPLRIGADAVVGMGAVVTKDVPPGAVVVGNPAKQLDR